MKLLFEKTKHGRSAKSNELRINKTQISIKENFAFQNQINFGGYAAIGLNASNNLCLFYSSKEIKGFYKVTKNKASKNYMYLGFSIPKRAHPIMSGFVGSYEAGTISIKNNIKEIELIKIL